jgi:hypothetical protein
MMKKAVNRKNKLPRASVSQIAIPSIFLGFMVRGAGMDEIVCQLQLFRWLFLFPDNKLIALIVCLLFLN